MSNCRGVISARGALNNCSIFRREGKLPVDDVMKDYLKLCVETDNVDSNTKYNVMRVMTTRDEKKVKGTSSLPLSFQLLRPIRSITDVH